MTLQASQSWLHQVAVAFDMLAGVTAGLPYDCTISTYVGLVRSGYAVTYHRWERPVCVWLANQLDRIEAGHCESARLADIERARESAAFLSYQAPEPV